MACAHGHEPTAAYGDFQARAYSDRDSVTDGHAQACGDSTLDIHLNGSARWSNVPAAVWNYKLGGYQVLKKWLSYREHKVLGRNMHPEEVRHFTHTARRIAAILMLTARPTDPPITSSPRSP